VITIKCIKKKCRYCSQHDYYASYAICSLTHDSFPIVGNKTCDISDIIYNLQNEIDKLQEYKDTIEANQEE
jgi:hypothetical protein